jgi:ribonucleoside-diphosphate reductase alpha chain
MSEHPDTMSYFARNVMWDRYSHDAPGGRKESWFEIADRTVNTVYSAVGLMPDHPIVARTRRAVRKRQFMPGGRYLFSTGFKFHQTQNCVLMRAVDTREGWGDIMRKVTLASMTGAGLGVYYGDLRASDSPLHSGGGTSSGPIPLMYAVNEMARSVRQGGKRRGAVWAGLPWDHPDILKFIRAKNWSEDVKRMKEQDFNFPAALDMTNISVCLNDEFFLNYRRKDCSKHELAHRVFWETAAQACQTGEPGFSVDVGPNSGEVLRNACTEISSFDPDDICNLGSINMARVSSLEEMESLVEIATSFLLAGTVYSDVPYPEVAATRAKNRRLGLGLMGIHEWLLQRGKRYGRDSELQPYLEAYRDISSEAARHFAHMWGISVPVKTRAIAPNGTIGIVAETTTGIEPIFCAAYKRRYRDGENWLAEYVLDPTAKRLVDAGADPDSIEDAYSIDVARRIDMQVWLQEYVDHGISSTINMPAWGSKENNSGTVQAFGELLLENLPKLRGITVYPDGARGGQPLNRVPYKEAMSLTGRKFVEGADVCDITRAGGCG